MECYTKFGISLIVLVVVFLGFMCGWNCRAAYEKTEKFAKEIENDGKGS